MANLNTLISNRNSLKRRGIESQRAGQVFYHTFTDTSSGRCQFCWISPGTGYAVVEIWGAAGSGARQCCCTQTGVPGNPGAYSKKTVPVCAGTYICGWAGCSTEAQTLCYSGRGNCSVACIFNSGANGTMIATAGFGGYTLCTTSTPQYCCMAAAGFCQTNTGAGCGIICNIGGPNAATDATASGGDLNVNGGVSCVHFWCCLNCGQQSAPEQTIAISAGIYSTCWPTCLKYARNANIINRDNAATGRYEMDIALSSLMGMMPTSPRCWNSINDCGCYEFSGCSYGGVGIPGSNGWPCANVRSKGMRGGHGAIRVTFYS